ncbi:MAG TPA: 2-amino-4-hydroxy-6-hydroxymethyldihydropteridine diphosphokinase [Clostridiaceae bacterium]
MDKIYIKDLQVFAYHGVHEEENSLGQRFLISLWLSLDLKAAGRSDDLKETVSYSEVCKRVSNLFISKKYKLLESCANALTSFLLNNYPSLTSVKVLIKKPWAPIGLPLEYASIEFERSRSIAYISLGSNLGDKESYINKALQSLNTPSITLLKVSSKYDTKPVGYLDQDNFLNLIAKIETILTPRELLNDLLKIENALGRVRTVKWGPRTIDLDIILFDNIIVQEEDLFIPHPRMAERLFVLTPLNEIAPYALHPILGKRIYQLKEELELVAAT